MKVKSDVFGTISNNCYLITDEKTMKSALVDCTDNSQKMYDLIGDADLQYILLTHGHFDHIGGVKAVKEKFDAKVVISNQDAPMLNSGKLSLAAFCSLSQENTNADITVDDGDFIMLGETRINIISTPGHTKGSVCYIADGCIFTGDTLFYCSCGRTDFPGGSSAQMSQSLRKIAALEGDYKIFPGHDSFSTLDYERKNNPYIR